MKEADASDQEVVALLEQAIDLLSGRRPASSYARGLVANLIRDLETAQVAILQEKDDNSPESSGSRH